MQSSGEAGVVVVTFGSMVTNFTSERAEVIAAAFGRLPQKVTIVTTLIFKLGCSETTENDADQSCWCPNSLDMRIRTRILKTQTAIDLKVK